MSTPILVPLSPILRYRGIAAPHLKQDGSLGMETGWATEDICVRFRAKARDSSLFQSA
jgi:hypothetical protein